MANIEKHAHDPVEAIELFEQGPGFELGENDGSPGCALGSLNGAEVIQGKVQDLAIKKQKGTESLVLGGRADIRSNSEGRKVWPNFGSAHFFWVSLAVEENEPLDPGHVGFLGPDGVVVGAQYFTHLVEQFGLARGRFRGDGISHDHRGRYFDARPLSGWRLCRGVLRDMLQNCSPKFYGFKNEAYYPLGPSRR
jgi:hypothetical protein